MHTSIFALLALAAVTQSANKIAQFLLYSAAGVSNITGNDFGYANRKSSYHVAEHIYAIIQPNPLVTPSG